MKNIGNKLFLWGMLLSATPLLMNCSKQKEAEIMDLHSVNTQLRSFALSKTSLPALSNIHFSIRNSQQGEVWNSESIAYGVDLTDVRLNIVPAQTDVKIEVAVGEQGDFESWTATKVYDLSSATAKVLRIRLTQINVSNPLSYTYKVSISQHKFDPQTISWAKGGASIPVRPSYMTIINNTNRKAQSLYTWSATEGLRSFSLDGNNWITTNIHSGLPTPTRKPQIVGVGNDVFALIDGILYQRSNNQWTAISGINKTIVALLGYLPQGGEAPEGVLALIAQEGNQNYFATLKNGTIALYSRVPEDFPTANFASIVQPAVSYQGASLLIAGGQIQQTPSSRKVWETSNGRDWMNVSTLEPAEALSSSVFTLDGNLYLQELVSEKGEHKVIFHKSVDGGHIWVKQDDIATTALNHSAISIPSLAYTTTEVNTIYLLGDVIEREGVTWVWKGSLRDKE